MVTYHKIWYTVCTPKCWWTSKCRLLTSLTSTEISSVCLKSLILKFLCETRDVFPKWRLNFQSNFQSNQHQNYTFISKSLTPSQARVCLCYQQIRLMLLYLTILKPTRFVDSAWSYTEKATLLLGVVTLRNKNLGLKNF